MSDLVSKHCVPCEGGVPPLTTGEVKRMLSELAGWQLSADEKSIFREFRFKNYYQTIAFVNAIAWVAHQEDHHPDLELSYDRCCVRYTTHAIGGLSDNDLICAAKVSSLQGSR